MLSAIPSVTVLGMVAIFAIRLAQRRSSPIEAATERFAASTVLGATTAIQGVHFAEEWSTGFHIQFPALMGLDPMPLSFFVTFNISWLAIWVVSMPLIRRGSSFAFFAAWFLAIAAMLNGVAHPIMALGSGSYFPGLLTSPLIGIAGVILWQRLREATVGPAPIT